MLMPTFIVQAGIGNLLKLYCVFDEVIKVIIDIEQLKTNNYTVCKLSSCSKMRHMIATLIYTIMTLLKHRFESHKYVNVKA